MRTLLSVILAIGLLPLLLRAQAPVAAVVIDSIRVTGNHKTKKSIILRELTVRNGDTIPLSKLGAVLQDNQFRLLNTSLFNVATVNAKNWSDDNHVTLDVAVVEKWYLFPVPIFELADRNLNVWIKEFNASLNRTNYGFRLTHGNVSGRRDPLSASFQFGYTPRVSFAYSQPFINKKQTIGISAGFAFTRNHEIGYATRDNRWVFYKDRENFVFNRYSGEINVTYRPKLFTNHYFSFGFTRNQIDSVVANDYNRDYFLDGKTQQRYFWLGYSCSHDTRDIRPFPLNGHMFSFGIAKTGLSQADNVNSLDVSARWAQYFQFSKHWSLEAIAKLKTALIRTPQPYNFTRALGFGSDFIRGYEYYVIDGYDFGYVKSSLRYELLNRDVSLKKLLPFKLLSSFWILPLKAYLSANFDVGYANHPRRLSSNTFANRPIYGGGLGLNIIMYYNMVGQIEYSVNHLGNRDIYIHYRVAF